MNTIAQIGIDCVGCRSCEQSCPQKCIHMVENEEGFLYPMIHMDSCIRCGICFRSCPVSVERKTTGKPLQVHAFRAKDSNRLFHSASGGAADIATKAVLDKNGVVYGAAYDHDLKVSHIEVTETSEAKRLQSSKYVQSDIGNTYRQAKLKLQEGHIVLFTGTPCQIAGLYSFLDKTYENLFTIDLVCHGVPSPLLFQKYLEWYGNKIGKKVESYNFRSKQKWGWGTRYLVKTKTKIKTNILSLDRYGKHFMLGDCYRESCYRCRFANTNRPADLTIGDFWGIEKSHPDFSSHLGVSVVLTNTKNGQRLLDWMKKDADIIPATLDEALVKQGNLIHPTKRPTMRDSFYLNLAKDDFIDKLHVGLQLKERIKSILPRDIVAMIKKFT